MVILIPSNEGSSAFLISVRLNPRVLDPILRLASLNIGSKTRGFSLTEIKNAELPSLDGIRMTTAVIQVEDLEKIYEKIIDMNLGYTAIDQDITPEGVTFAEFSFTDYDGHLVVLYELK